MTVVSTKSTVSPRAPGGRKATDDQAVLAAAGHLTSRDRYLVRLTGQHRVLTTDQLCALGFDSIITARHRLGVLVSIGVLRRFRPRREVGSAPWHYLLGPVGAALLGAEDRDDRRWLPQVRAGRQLALERSQQLAHMTGRNWFFVALARQARDGSGQLRAWLNETESAERYADRVLGGYGDRVLPRPDGTGTWAEHGRAVTFLLEYDTGSENLPRLTGKLVAYGHLAQGMATAERICPPLLFCFHSPRREQAARRALAGCGDAPALRIATAALDPQHASPAGPVWLPLLCAHDRQMPLIDLDAAMPDPWQDHRADTAQRRREREQQQPAWKRQPYDDTSDTAPADPGDADDLYGP